MLKAGLKVLSLVSVLGLSSSALAWDGQISGKIERLEFTNSGENYGFRIQISEKKDGFCGAGTEAWAYVNQSTSKNYQAIIGAAMAVRAMNKEITLFLEKDERENV